ncbi:MAG: transposase [Magnetococcales bacterium]|nr:transposase [Magnetococcales bacterium]
MLECGLVQTDETPVQVLKEPGKEATSKSWMLVQRGVTAQGPAILFEYDPTRSEELPKRVLDGFKGLLQTDAYVAYLGDSRFHAQ